MAWQKQVTKAPELTNEDLNFQFFKGEDGVTVVFTVNVPGEDRPEMTRFLAEDSITNGQLNQLKTILLDMRSFAMTRLGYVDV